MRRRQRFRSRKSSSGAAKALALFILLCGVIVFVGSFAGEDEGSDQAKAETRGPSVKDVARALDHVESAAHALDATDYGRARWHLYEGRQTLERSLK